MLVCISANPAIDRRLRLENIAVGEINRALSAQPFPGGKAAHVAMVAKALGVDVMWVGFLGGAAGEQCESGLSAFGIPLTVIRTQSETRVNLELVSADGKVTEILEPGGAVTEGEVERLLTTCRDLFAETSEHILNVGRAFDRHVDRYRRVPDHARHAERPPKPMITH